MLHLTFYTAMLYLLQQVSSNEIKLGMCFQVIHTNGHVSHVDVV